MLIKSVVFSFGFTPSLTPPVIRVIVNITLSSAIGQCSCQKFHSKLCSRNSFAERWLWECRAFRSTKCRLYANLYSDVQLRTRSGLRGRMECAQFSGKLRLPAKTLTEPKTRPKAISALKFSGRDACEITPALATSRIEKGMCFCYNFGGRKRWENTSGCGIATVGQGCAGKAVLPE